MLTNKEHAKEDIKKILKLNIFASTNQCLQIKNMQKRI